MPLIDGMRAFVAQTVDIDRKPHGFRQSPQCSTSLAHARCVIQVGNTGDLHCRDTQGTWLATRIQVAAAQIDGAKLATGISDRFRLAVGGRVMVLERTIDPLAHDLAVPHHDRPERLRARCGQGLGRNLDGTAHESLVVAHRSASSAAKHATRP